MGLVASRRAVIALAGAGFMATSIGGLLLATTSLGLFGFRESLAAPFAGLTLGIEVAGLLLLTPGLTLSAARGMTHHWGSTPPRTPAATGMGAA